MISSRDCTSTHSVGSLLRMTREARHIAREARYEMPRAFQFASEACSPHIGDVAEYTTWCGVQRRKRMSTREELYLVACQNTPPQVRVDCPPLWDDETGGIPCQSASFELVNRHTRRYITSIAVRHVEGKTFQIEGACLTRNRTGSYSVELR